MGNRELPEHINLQKLREIFAAVTKRRVSNEDDAEEIVQDALLTVMEKHDAQQYEKGFLQWAFGVLRNKIGNYYQKRRRWAGHVREADEDVLRVRSDPGAGPLEIFEESEAKDKIASAWRQLDEHCRRLLWMLYHGHSRQEIFRAFPRYHFKVVNTKIFRCRNYLKRLLRKEGYQV